mmetsp:Transcript_4660/g.12409  ORF Transcript_4660/g.12409 Transcript_4660/m.12409 type:complete len:210 (-) Transcript_4660:29-658(-)
MKPLVPSIGSSTHTRSPAPRGGSSPLSTAVRKASLSVSPPKSPARRNASAQRSSSARRSAASSSPMKRSSGNCARSAEDTRPWMAKSPAVTGVESPGLMKETPVCVSHASIVLPCAADSTICISHASALQSCIAFCTAATAAAASASKSPPHGFSAAIGEVLVRVGNECALTGTALSGSVNAETKSTAEPAIIIISPGWNVQTGATYST